MPPTGTFPRSLEKHLMSPEHSKMSRTSPLEAMSLDEKAAELEFCGVGDNERNILR